MTNKRRAKTKVNQKWVPFNFQISESMYEGLVETSKIKNMYMSELIRNLIAKAVKGN